jgi:DNA-binding NarL/FixJ family response regulator
MPSTSPSSAVAPLRVLVADGGRPASTALAEWLREQNGLEVQGPLSPLTSAIALAAKFCPHVVLLDFHGLPVSVGYTVALLKELTPPPTVFVLTHEVSEAMRRRCREAGVDAIFNKTTELELLAHGLSNLARGSAAEARTSP